MFIFSYFIIIKILLHFCFANFAFLSLTSYALFGFLCFMFEFKLTKVYLFIVCFHSFHACDIMKSKIYSLGFFSNQTWWWTCVNWNKIGFSLYFVSFNYFGCSCFGSKTQGRKGLKLKMEFQPLKKIMKLNILTFKKMRLYNDIMLKHMFMRNKVPRFKNASSKIHIHIFQ